MADGKEEILSLEVSFCRDLPGPAERAVESWWSSLQSVRHNTFVNECICTPHCCDHLYAPEPRSQSSPLLSNLLHRCHSQSTGWCCSVQRVGLRTHAVGSWQTTDCRSGSFWCEKERCRYYRVSWCRLLHFERNMDNSEMDLLSQGGSNVSGVWASLSLLKHLRIGEVQVCVQV